MHTYLVVSPLNSVRLTLSKCGQEQAPSFWTQLLFTHISILYCIARGKPHLQKLTTIGKDNRICHWDQ